MLYLSTYACRLCMHGFSDGEGDKHLNSVYTKLKCFSAAWNSLKRPSKGFERQATLRQNVATICYQSTDNRQKLTRKKRQFAKTTIHFSFRQSDNCTFFLRRLHGCHMNLYRKTTATISSAGQATKVHKRMRQGDKTTPLGRPP